MQGVKDPRVLGGVAGGLAGAGLVAFEAHRGLPYIAPARREIQVLEDKAKRRGLRGFVANLDLAKKRYEATLYEGIADHPVASAVAGAGVGATMGMRLGPSVQQALDFYRKTNG